MTGPHPIPDAALESDIAILGKKGRGKSYTARGIAERLLAMGRRVVVLDPLSTWWGLAAGDAGFPIAVLGGPHGDLPLSADDGEALGRYLATADQGAVLDLGHMRKGELIRFATPFLEELYTHNRDPLWLVLEEADVFAPQNPGADTARLYGEVDRIARRGRQFGFRLISLTQRPARLAKDVLTQLSTLVALGITSPQDREAIKAWVEGNADRDQARAVVDSLASLKVGEGWVWAPDLDLLERVTFPPNRTPDTSATPKAGEARPGTSIRQAVDVAALKTALASADTKSTGPSKVSASAPRAADTTPAQIAAAEQRGYQRGLEEGLRRGGAYAERILSEIDRVIEPVYGLLERHMSAASTGRWALSAAEGAIAPELAPPPRASHSAKQDAVGEAKSPAREPSGTISPARRRILDALAWFESIGIMAPDREVVAFLAGASSGSSSFANNLGGLRTDGLVDYPDGGLVALTVTGRAAAVCPAARLTHADIAAAVRQKLVPAQWRLLESLIAAYPKGVSRDHVAEAAGVSASSSSFANNLGRLRSLGLLTYPASGFVRAAEILFPERA